MIRRIEGIKQEDPYIQNILDWKNTLINEDSLQVVDIEKEESINEQAMQYVEIQFSDRMSYPSFQIDIINPIYEIQDQRLIVKHQNKIIFEFDLSNQGSIV